MKEKEENLTDSHTKINKENSSLFMISICRKAKTKAET
jgi:hypothetical protein